MRPCGSGLRSYRHGLPPGRSALRPFLHRRCLIGHRSLNPPQEHRIVERSSVFVSKLFYLPYEAFDDVLVSATDRRGANQRLGFSTSQTEIEDDGSDTAQSATNQFPKARDDLIVLVSR